MIEEPGAPPPTQGGGGSLLSQARHWFRNRNAEEGHGLLFRSATPASINESAPQEEGSSSWGPSLGRYKGRLATSLWFGSLSLLVIVFILLSILGGTPKGGALVGPSDSDSADSSAPSSTSSSTPSTTDTPATDGSAWHEDSGVPIGSPQKANPHYQEPGCPPLGTPPQGRRFIQIKNNCRENVWPGMIPAGAAVPPGNSWLWRAGECKTLDLPSALPSLRIWARTHCDADFRCTTGSCRVEGNGGCASAGEAPCSLWEATLQEHCTPQPVGGGLGPDFYDQSLVDGFNVAVQVRVSGGYNVGRVPPDYSCQHPVVNPFNTEECPYELRVYADQIPGTVLPVQGINGVNTEVSPCFKTPLKTQCQRQVIGCRSLCKSMDQGWIGFYIDNVQGDPNVVNPWLTRPNGARIRWAEQFLQGRPKCGATMCKDVPAWGAYRGDAYSGGGNMKNLVCCDFGFRCSPYQPNNVPGGCPYDQACPTLGSADPLSRFHHSRADDSAYPQQDEALRMSSSLPDWPMPTKGGNYAKIYKDSSPSAYSWQYNDASSTYTCCGKEGEPGPSYIVTFCPD